ncbi:sodium/hydrogen exchanger [Luminiphilus syltensis NOR5-1B]|uniref:Sodium/hydrogen exchanger n=1 Tax=Luminiphilus syltensis NOR5-1B TaxID=565045 RepID=B8KWC6_9GAMM|nr:cation:proton antiporter family protein [Luminiphilus syltensis]EED35767.1 sodium/hydrogen exchanger [Luminiphilus syltensis NOR5-1B]
MLGLDPLIIVTALLCGMLSRAAGLPALVGYLAAGFVLHEFSLESGALLEHLADVGITLMLFTIGLKLDARKLLQTKVWGTTVIHMAVTHLVMLGLLLGASALIPGLQISLTAALVIAFALTFSSTVFVIQTLQERGESTSAHANLAIGILIVQDLVAVVFLAFSTSKAPQLEALWLLLIIPARPLILKLLSVAGYGELLTLSGLALALGAAQLSDAVGIKGDLGALLFGAILAGHPKAKDMAKNLIQFKDLFLVGFFLSIGLAGWPSTTLIFIAVILGLLATLKPLLYFLLMTRFHTSARVAVLASGSLANYSEFGLIVVAVAATVGWVDPQWSGAISIAIAVSFVVAAPLSTASHRFYQTYRDRLFRFQSDELMASMEPISDTRIIILGMGRVGTGAYESLAPRFGPSVLGVESGAAQVAVHKSENRRVIRADASDPDFWQRIDINNVQLVMLALTNHPENMLVAGLLRSLNYSGELAAVVRYADHEVEMSEHGISAFNLYGQAGAGFAAHASELINGSAETTA